MHTSVFKILVLLCILGIGGMFLFVGGFLPTATYAALYRITDNIPAFSQNSAPYVQKYEGHWMFSLISSQKNSVYIPCPSFTVILTTHNGQSIGHASVPGYLIGIEASTTVSGFLSGGFYSANQQYNAKLRGTVQNGSGSGSWVDSEECTGTWSMQKSSPVVDPIQGTIVSLNGRVILERPDEALEAWPEESLYAGDRLKIPPGGSATITLGIGINNAVKTIPENTTYVVPDVNTAAQ